MLMAKNFIKMAQSSKKLYRYSHEKKRKETGWTPLFLDVNCLNGCSIFYSDCVAVIAKCPTVM